jgi:hypothetical protein
VDNQEPDSVYGFGKNTFNQTTLKNLPPTADEVAYETSNSGTIILSKDATMALRRDIYDYVGTPLTGQSKNIPYFTDFGVGNGYSVFIHETGYPLFKFAYFTNGFSTRFDGYNSAGYGRIERGIANFIESGQFNRCSGSIYAPVRTQRTVKKIRAGRDYCLMLSNEGRVITPFCHNPYYQPVLPRHFTSVGLAQFNINTPPISFGVQPLADIQIGHFHVIALTTDHRILMWGVSPDFPFYRQYYQTVIPPRLENANNVIQIAAGKYHSSVIIASQNDTKYSTDIVSFGEPESSN